MQMLKLQLISCNYLIVYLDSIYNVTARIPLEILSVSFFSYFLILIYVW